MSYDCGLWINTGIEQVQVPGTQSNYTYNVSPMLKLAFDNESGINVMEGKNAVYSRSCLIAAIRRMEDTDGRYRPLNPANGWGSYEGCLRWLRTILSHCEQHPLATLRIT